MQLIDDRYLAAQGHTPEYLAFMTGTVPGMIEETIKRLKAIPFDRDSLYVAHSGGRSSTLIMELLGEASIGCPVVFNIEPGVTAPELTKTLTQYYYSAPAAADAKEMGLITCISGLRMDRHPGKTLDVRGVQWPIEQMPMYLELGEHGQQYVYPLFDWSTLQVELALKHFHIPFMVQ